MFRSWLGALNFLVLQWFFVRLAYVSNDDTKQLLYWKVLFPVVPLIGWDFTLPIKAKAIKDNQLIEASLSLRDFTQW